MAKYTSTVRWTNTLARREVNELFRALTELANLGDTLNDVRFFRKRWPDFFPKPFYDETERLMNDPAFWDYAFMRIKRALHDLWTGQNRAPFLVPQLLGIRASGLSYYITTGNSGDPTDMHFDWKTGKFLFASKVKFHQAMWFLSQQTWRAKVCGHCGGCFVAKRQTQLYCSSDCSEQAERAWKRDWWRKHGEDWRRKRTAKPGGEARHRNGGK